MCEGVSPEAYNVLAMLSSPGAREFVGFSARSCVHGAARARATRGSIFFLIVCVCLCVCVCVCVCTCTHTHTHVRTHTTHTHTCLRVCTYTHTYTHTHTYVDLSGFCVPVFFPIIKNGKLRALNVWRESEGSYNTNTLTYSCTPAHMHTCS